MVTRIVGLDPGVSTVGLALFDMLSGTLEVRKVEKPSGILSMGLPDIITYVDKHWAEVLAPLGGLEETEFVIEYPHISGSFSVGLTLAIQSLVLYLRKHGCPKVTLIPNRIPEFFLKKRSATGTETVHLAKAIFGLDGRRLSVHESDALLFLLFTNSGLLRSRGLVRASFREPVYTVEVKDIWPPISPNTLLLTQS